MNKRTKIIIIIVIILLVCGMALWPVLKRVFIGTNSEGVGAPPIMTQRSALNVNAKILKEESLNDIFITKGVLVPDEEVDLTFETSGKITNIFFKEGTSVRKGELLAKVNDKPLQAELQKLEAQIPLAEARVARQQALLKKDAVSQEAFESVQTELDKLRADIDLAKARIAQTELRAPFDGVVGLREISEGTYASPTTIITKLTKLTPLKIEFSVNENQANDVKAGTPLKFTVANDPNVYDATVYAVESRLDRTTLTLIARARYNNPGGHLLPGLSAEITINLQRFNNALVIPSMSMVAEMGRDIAYIYDNGVARQVILTKGMRTSTSVQILEGLVPGDTLITTGVMQLRDEMPVVLGNIVE